MKKISCDSSKAAVQARLTREPQLDPVSPPGIPPGSVLLDTCAAWLLVVALAGGITMAIIYVLSHPTVKVM